MKRNINKNTSEMPEQLSRNDELLPVEEKGNGVLTAGMSIVIGGGVFLMAAQAFLMSATPGATRSSRLEFEKRNAEFIQAVQAEEAKKEQLETIEKDKIIERVKEKQ